MLAIFFPGSQTNEEEELKNLHSQKVASQCGSIILHRKIAKEK